MLRNSQNSKSFLQSTLMYLQLVATGAAALATLGAVLGSVTFTISQLPTWGYAIANGISFREAQISLIALEVLKKYQVEGSCNMIPELYTSSSHSDKIQVQTCIHDIYLVTMVPEDPIRGLGTQGFLALPHAFGANNIATSTGWLQVLTEPVFATELIKSPGSKQTLTIICTKLQDDERYLMRRIKDNPTGKCYEEIIDTATGNIVERKLDTTCDPNC